MDDVLGTEVEVEGNDQTEATTQSVEGSAEEAFFDAAKVAQLDPRLVPSYKEMQGAYTKKTQEIAEQRKAYAAFEKQYGDLSTVSTFLGSIAEPEGLLNWWAQVGEEMGLNRQQLAALFDATGGDPAQVVAAVEGEKPAGLPLPNDPNRPLTMADFNRYQQEQQAIVARQQEDQTVQTAMAKAGINRDDPQYLWVIQAAQRQPQYLGTEVRLQRGLAEYKQHLDSYAAQTAAKHAAKQAAAPKGLGGGLPAGGRPDAPKTFADAKASAKARMDALLAQQ